MQSITIVIKGPEEEYESRQMLGFFHDLHDQYTQRIEQIMTELSNMRKAKEDVQMMIDTYINALKVYGEENNLT